ncbi:MAG: hypothetical protein ABSG86_30720 [Thermoguttaceae bacterium]|jgi:hypothetical protein
MKHEFRSRRATLAADSAARGELAARLVECFRQGVQEMVSEDDYNCLLNAAREWEEMFFSAFQELLDLRKRSGISVPPRNLEPVYAPIGEAEVESYLRAKANGIAKARKLTLLFRRWAELKSHPDRIHAEIGSSAQEQDEDWYWAGACFALEVLEGKIPFAHRIGPDQYHLLESVWLEDAKRLSAYFLWEAAGSRWHEDGGAQHYFRASDRLRQAALEPRQKASRQSFARAETYIEQSYLCGGRVDATADSTAHDLIAKKAYRIWDRAGRTRPASANWDDAERYVRRFYDHIVPAANEGGLEDHRSVTDAVCSGLDGRCPCDVVNCFEALLVISYLDPAKLQECCDGRAAFLF